MARTVASVITNAALLETSPISASRERIFFTRDTMIDIPVSSHRACNPQCTYRATVPGLSPPFAEGWRLCYKASSWPSRNDG